MRDRPARHLSALHHAVINFWSLAAVVACLNIAAPAAAQDVSFKVGSTLKLDLKGRIDTDARTATNAIGLDASDVSINTKRIGVEGTFLKKVEFEVSGDVGSGGTWRDVYVNVKRTKALEIEAGQFKIPFSREALTGGKNLDFIERSLIARQLAPGRDVGVMAHGRLFHKRIDYAAGMFLRDGSSARTSSTHGGSQTFAGRIVFNPFDTLEVGAAATGSQIDNVLGLRGRTVFSDGVFFDRAYVNGRRWRQGLEAAWKRGPVSISSEYIKVTDSRSSMGFDGTDLDPVSAHGWYLAGTWALTGERKSGRLEPERPVLHGIGAIELVGRVEQLRFDSYDAVLQNADRVTTAGVNWYLNHYLRIQANVVVEKVADPQRSPAPSAGGHFVGGIVRLQFAL